MATIEDAKHLIKDTPISTIIGFYHPISKRGANYEGICPFHGDSHPSLKINDNKNIYKCFACGAAGDGIKFIQDKLGLSFVDAIKDLAPKLGITIEEIEHKKGRDPRFEMAMRVLKSANRLYKKCALEVNPPAFQNFIAKRKLNAESIKNFEIGYAPRGNNFLSYLKTVPAPEQELAIAMAQEISIIRNGEKGQYDFFRERITFPIWDHSGHVRGFSTRAVFDDQKPKYLNSGESLVFHKGNILYGMHLAKNAIRSMDMALIVEGNMDVVMLHQFGFQNAVGTMGVALSQHSASHLINITKNIVLGMDNDPAGFSAMESINKIFMEAKILPRMVDYAPWKDPDEFLINEGRIEFTKRLEDARTFIDVLIDKLVLNDIPESTDAKLSQLKIAFEKLSPLGEDLMAKEKLLNIAQALGLRSGPEDITMAYSKFLSEKNNQSKYTPKEQLKNAKDNDTPRTAEQTINIAEEKKIFSKASPPTRLELIVLEHMFLSPELTGHRITSEILDLVNHNEVKRLILWLKSIYREIDDSEYLNILRGAMEGEISHKEIHQVLANAIFQYTGNELPPKVAEKMLADVALRLKKENLRERKKRLKEEQKTCRLESESLAIMHEIQKVDQEIFLLSK